MSAEIEVIKIRKKLEKMIKNKTIEGGTVNELLNVLQDVPMSLKLLQKTKIGFTVNSLRKNTRNEELVTICKNMIKTWKKVLPDDIKTTPTASQSKKGSHKNATSKITAEKLEEADQKDPSTSNDVSGKDKDKNRKHGVAQGISKGAKKKPKKKAKHKDDDANELVRLKCQEMLVDALKPLDSGKVYVLEPSVLAQLIEQHQELKETGSKYKNRIRSRVANLKDLRHPALKENVLEGIISPERFAKMTAEEMASDEMRDLRAKYTKEAIKNHQMGKIDASTSDMFSCEKCGSKKCTYRQVQLLCSDEPMTTFLLCYTCGYRWSFC